VNKSASFWLAALTLASLAILAYFFSVFTTLLVLLSALGGFLLARVLMRRPVPADATSASAGERRSEHEADSLALGRLFEATMGGMREGLLVVDQDMRVVASNASARRLFSSSLQKLDSQRLTQLTRNPSIYGAFLDALQGKERSGVKVETFGEGRRVFDLRVVPLSSRDTGAADGAIGVFFDITQLEKLERVRQEFLSNVSHELRTPLTAILAFVETLESGPIDNEEDARRFLGIIRKNAARMHHLIDDILELSAIEAGTVKVDPKEIRLAQLVSDVVTSLDAKAASREITLINSIDAGAVVFADPARLEQMLTNLVDNAIKFNREGGAVTIRYESGDRSRILIEDTGEGIPAQHLERLFERFYRVDRARSRDMGGTGLGLAIVKHLALAHGGEVTVESRLGEGSVFGIELPLPGARVEESEALGTAVVGAR
jgi:two-component system phosphate regulon sensor histidine kinase PhoR